MDELKIYGNYYRLRKGFGNVPQDITILDIQDNDVVFCWGHFTEEQLNDKTHDYCIVKNKMRKDKVIKEISEQHKKIKEKEKRKLTGLINKFEQAKAEMRGEV